MSINRKTKNKEELVKYKTFDQLAYEELYNIFKGIINIEELLKIIMLRINDCFDLFLIYIERIPLKPGQSLSKTQLLILMRKLRSIFQLYNISIKYEECNGYSVIEKIKGIQFKCKI
nr:MAG TPA: hypothetical protein [Caudoviricetes sp.]